MAGLRCAADRVAGTDDPAQGGSGGRQSPLYANFGNIEGLEGPWRCFGHARGSRIRSAEKVGKAVEKAGRAVDQGGERAW